MREKLFTVEDRFKIPMRGIAVTGFNQSDLPEFEVGSPIALILPEGREIITEVAGFELFQTVSGKKGLGILLENVSKKNVPIGTKVYLEKAV